MSSPPPPPKAPAPINKDHLEIVRKKMAAPKGPPPMSMAAFKSREKKENDELDNSKTQEPADIKLVKLGIDPIHLAILLR